MADAIGFSQCDFALAEVETGKRNVSIENIARIATGLKVSLREFFNAELFDEKPIDSR